MSVSGDDEPDSWMLNGYDAVWDHMDGVGSGFMLDREGPDGLLMPNFFRSGIGNAFGPANESSSICPCKLDCLS